MLRDLWYHRVAKIIIGSTNITTPVIDDIVHKFKSGTTATDKKLTEHLQEPLQNLQEEFKVKTDPNWKVKAFNILSKACSAIGSTANAAKSYFTSKIRLQERMQKLGLKRKKPLKAEHTEEIKENPITRSQRILRNAFRERLERPNYNEPIDEKNPFYTGPSANNKTTLRSTTIDSKDTKKSTLRTSNLGGIFNRRLQEMQDDNFTEDNPFSDTYKPSPNRKEDNYPKEYNPFKDNDEIDDSKNPFSDSYKLSPNRKEDNYPKEYNPFEDNDEIEFSNEQSALLDTSKSSDTKKNLLLVSNEEDVFHDAINSDPDDVFHDARTSQVHKNSHPNDKKSFTRENNKNLLPKSIKESLNKTADKHKKPHKPKKLSGKTSQRRHNY